MVKLCVPHTSFVVPVRWIWCTRLSADAAARHTPHMLSSHLHAGMRDATPSPLSACAPLHQACTQSPRYMQHPAAAPMQPPQLTCRALGSARCPG
jgi:hypothetical protein